MHTLLVYFYFQFSIVFNAVFSVWQQIRLASYICYRLSIRLSVTWVDQSKTVVVRIMKFSPYSSPYHASRFCIVSYGNSNRFPKAGASNKGGVGKISHFLALSVNLENSSRYRQKTNSKSHVSFRVTPRSMISDDLELLQGQILSEFCMLSRFWEATMAKGMKTIGAFLRARAYMLSPVRLYVRHIMSTTKL